MTQLIDGKALAADIYKDIKIKVEDMMPKPKLGIILASNDPASHKYVELKMQKAKDLGIDTKLYHFGEDVTRDELITEIKKFKYNEAITGILLQLPLYDHLTKYTHQIVNAIDPGKDADGLTAWQQGQCLHLLDNAILPATVEAILECLSSALDEDITWQNILEKKNLETLEGKNVLIINDSNLIGRPLAMVLTSLRATVTVANKFTNNLKELTTQADIIVSATGKTNLITADMIKKDAILIDVTSVSKDGKVVGDFVVSDELKKKASFLTPVPGGVGPLTIACLLRNLVR